MLAWDAPRREPVDGQTIITVLLADDHAGVRAAIRSLLERAPLLQVAGEATDGAAAVRLAQELAPDLVLMDVGMPGVSGIEATRLIVALTRSRVIMLSLQGDRQVVLESLRAGAVGYVLKERAARELVRAIGRVMAGDRYVSDACDYVAGLGATWIEGVQGAEGAEEAGVDVAVVVAPTGCKQAGGD